MEERGCDGKVQTAFGIRDVFSTKKRITESFYYSSLVHLRGRHVGGLTHAKWLFFKNYPLFVFFFQRFNSLAILFRVLYFFKCTTTTETFHRGLICLKLVEYRICWFIIILSPEYFQKYVQRL